MFIGFWYIIANVETIHYCSPKLFKDNRCITLPFSVLKVTRMRAFSEFKEYNFSTVKYLSTVTTENSELSWFNWIFKYTYKNMMHILMWQRNYNLKCQTLLTHRMLFSEIYHILKWWYTYTIPTCYYNALLLSVSTLLFPKLYKAFIPRK